jgi:hypothetical protein
MPGALAVSWNALCGFARFPDESGAARLAPGLLHSHDRPIIALEKR